MLWSSNDKSHQAHQLFTWLKRLKYPFFIFIYEAPEAIFDCVEVRDMYGADAGVCWSHEGVESRCNHFGLGEATASRGQNRVDGKWLRVKG